MSVSEENFYRERQDPWGYQRNESDRYRKNKILSVCHLHGPFKRALDVGAGEGWITQYLPADEKWGFESSDTAASRFPAGVKRCLAPEGKYDLIIATGVLYEHYNGKALIDLINEHASNIVVTCHIKTWEIPEVLNIKGAMEFELDFLYENQKKYIQKLRVFRREATSQHRTKNKLEL